MRTGLRVLVCLLASFVVGCDGGTAATNSFKTGVEQKADEKLPREAPTD